MSTVAFDKLSLKKFVSLNIFLVFLFIVLGEGGPFFTGEILAQSPLWPVSGIVLGLVMQYQLSALLPGILLGSILLAVLNKSSVILGPVLSYLIELMIASLLLRSYGKEKFKLKSPKDIIFFILMGAILAPFVSSTISVTFSYMEGDPAWTKIRSAWITYFLNHSLSILIMTPIVRSFITKFRMLNLETVVLYLSLVALCFWAFEGESTLRKFAIIPLLTWIALRFSFCGVGIAALIVGYMAMLTSAGAGDDYLLLVQLIMSGISIVGYFLATVTNAQETANEKEIELSVKEEALAILDQSLHKSPFAFGLIDSELRYIRVNKSLASMNSIGPDAHLGKPIFDLMPIDCEKSVPLIKDVFETGKSFMNIPVSGHWPRDPSVTIAGHMSCYPVRHPSTEEIFAVAFTFQDMTEQLKIQALLHENQERLNFAQEAGKIGAFEWDLVKNKIIWTPELESIYELRPGDFDGDFETWTSWLHPSDKEGFQEEIQKVILNQKELNYQFRIMTKAKEARWILARGKVMGHSQGLSEKLVGINIDITEQKINEEKLRQVETDLLHALSVRDEFMAIASHELKTPLTSLKLQNQLFHRQHLEKKTDTLFPQKINAFIGKNNLHIDRLTRLVDDMLDISRIRTGKFSLKKEYCEISVIINGILSRTKEQFELSSSGEPVVETLETAIGLWDPLRIEQVLTNILTNAIRYGEGKPITISAVNFPDVVRISIKDQGMGIPEAEQEKIFQRYERGHVSREVSGLGLGLFITKQIVDSHEGKIWVESALNQGSTFIVELPTAQIPFLLNPEKLLIEVGSS